MAGEQNDQGRPRLDGSTRESVTDVLLHPISAAVEIVEPPTLDQKVEMKPVLAGIDPARVEAVLRTSIARADRGFEAATRSIWEAPPVDLSGDRERQAIRGEYVYGGLGLVFGVTAILGGLALALHGIGDGTSWTARLIGLRTELRDTGPGAILFLVGIFLLWTTRPVLRLKELRGH